MSKHILFAILTGVLILSPRPAHSELRVSLSVEPRTDAARYPVTTGVPFAKGTVKQMAEAYKLTGDERYREQAIRILEQEVYPYAHTADNGFGPALADGVWWVEDEDAGGWRNQAWMVDQMGDALYSTYTILDDGPVKERTRKALLDVADWVIDYAWKPEPGGLAVQYTKTKEGAYTAHQTYDGFIVMLAVSTSARAYALTGEQKYLDTARALFQTSVKTGRKAVNEGKQVGQVMQYAPIYMAIEADSSEAVENGK